MEQTTTRVVGSTETAMAEFPRVPTHELSRQNIKLPDLRTVLSPQFEQRPPSASEGSGTTYGSPGSIRSLPPIDVGPGRVATGVNDVMDVTMHSPSEEDRGRTRTVKSMDDRERMAVEALSGLGGPGFVRSPTYPAQSSIAPHDKTTTPNEQPYAENDAEPILQLLASKHPWVGGTINGSINGSMYVYNTTKHYSPRFVQNSATMVERNIATPLVNTVGSVGRITGVEGGLRRYLDGRTAEDLERADGKQPDYGDAMDIDSLEDGRRESAEMLPAYRASKPPSYREEYSPSAVERAQDPQHRPSHNRSISARVFVLTSGLGVALSATSRQSLQFCLHALTQASSRVDITMKALSLVLQQYDQARQNWRSRNESSVETGEAAEDDDAARRLAEVIKYHSDEIWNTLKNVTKYISDSAGSALPENAKHFVRSQVLSLPQRWQLVSRTQIGESETSRGAHRMIAFATEGLDMMGQISQVLTATLESAQQWLERAGRRERGEPIVYRDEKGRYETESSAD